LESTQSAEAEIMELFVKNAMHVGSKVKVRHTEKFIFRLRQDGVYLIDIKKTLERLNVAAKFISFFPPEKVVVVSTHVYGIRAVQRFCELTGCIPVVQKIRSGMFTNRVLKYYIEPQLLLVSDPRYDAQAINEAAIARIPVIAFCSTDNMLTNIDLAVPINNRGKSSLPYAFWYLAKRVLMERGLLTPEVEAGIQPESFMPSSVA